MSQTNQDEEEPVILGVECSCYGVSLGQDCLFCLSNERHISEMENIFFSAVMFGAPSVTETTPFNFKCKHKRTGGSHAAGFPHLLCNRSSLFLCVFLSLRHSLSSWKCMSD